MAYSAALANIVDIRGWNALHYAAALGDSQLLRELLEQDATELEREDLNGDTALHCAAGGGKLSAVKALLSYGAVPNYRNKLMRTPLHMACQAGSQPCALALMEARADLNTRDVRHYTPLHLAIRAGDIETVKLLLAHQADVMARTYRGRNALHLACSGGFTAIAEFLAEQYPALLDQLDHIGNTPLHCAVAAHHTDIVVALYRARADITIKNEHGYTAWELASSVSMKKLLAKIMEHRSRISLEMAKKAKAFAISHVEQVKKAANS